MSVLSLSLYLPPFMSFSCPLDSSLSLFLSVSLSLLQQSLKELVLKRTLININVEKVVKRYISHVKFSALNSPKR